jgi:hypothetical protein
MVPTEEQLDRLEDALHHVQTHPEQWRQSDWMTVTECGTVACLAGHVVLRAGFETRSAPWYFDLDHPREVVPQVRVDGQWRIATVVVRDVAKELLGLDEYRTTLLFAGSNTLPEMWLALEEISDGTRRAPQDAVTDEQREDLVDRCAHYRARS